MCPTALLPPSLMQRSGSEPSVAPLPSPCHLKVTPCAEPRRRVPSRRLARRPSRDRRHRHRGPRATAPGHTLRARRPQARAVIFVQGRRCDLCPGRRGLPPRWNRLRDQMHDARHQGGRCSTLQVPSPPTTSISQHAPLGRRPPPSVQVIAVEPRSADVLSRSLLSGHRVADAGPQGAQGVFVSQIGSEVFRVCDELVDEVRAELTPSSRRAHTEHTPSSRRAHAELMPSSCRSRTPLSPLGLCHALPTRRPSPYRPPAPSPRRLSPACRPPYSPFRPVPSSPC
jgi:hypothetical protein